ncbi:hypothetical protein F5Y15DRAFT_393350 [Xylariaceae sp. FL0016]|nr:hypothetical protein F5Y15DRAFT_393350 [Xylariaceae sp. FL0016]
MSTAIASIVLGSMIRTLQVPLQTDDVMQWRVLSSLPKTRNWPGRDENSHPSRIDVSKTLSSGITIPDKENIILVGSMDVELMFSNKLTNHYAADESSNET